MNPTSSGEVRHTMRKVQLVLACLLLLTIPQTVSSQATVFWTQLAEGFGKGFLSNDLAVEVFKWLTAKPASAEKAKPHVIALYRDLLGLQTTRNNLIKGLSQRLKQFGKST